MEYTTFKILFKKYTIIHKKYSCNCHWLTFLIRLNRFFNRILFFYPVSKYFKNNIEKITNEKLEKINASNINRINELKAKLLIKSDDVLLVEQIHKTTLRNLNSTSTKGSIMANCFFYIIILAIVNFLNEYLKSCRVFDNLINPLNIQSGISALIMSIAYIMVFTIYTLIILTATTKDTDIYDDLLNDLDYIIIDIKNNMTSSEPNK